MEDTKSKQQKQTTAPTLAATAVALPKKIDGQNDVGINVIRGIKRNRKMKQPNKSNRDCIKKCMLLLL